MKKYFVYVLVLFLPFQSLAGGYEDQAKVQCEFTSVIALYYAQFKFENRGYSVDSINYKDPVTNVLVPLVDELTNNGATKIGATEVALLSQSAIDGEAIYDVMEKHGSDHKLVAVVASTLELACYYKKGMTLEQVKALTSSK